MTRGAKGLWSVCLLLALSTCAYAHESSENERLKRNAYYGGGYGAGPMPGPYAGGPEPFPVAPIAPVAPVVPVGPVAPVVPIAPGQCPGGPSLGKACDAKRPWPQCPPSSYCFAVNTVDIGPYYCCPVWSTVGAQWRPAAPFYPYYPPMPFNWPYVIQATAHWGAQTSPAAGWLGQFGPAPGMPAGGPGAFVAPAVPDVGPGPYGGGPMGPGPMGPFEKTRKKNTAEAVKVEAVVAPVQKEENESS